MLRGSPCRPFSGRSPYSALQTIQVFCVVFLVLAFPVSHIHGQDSPLTPGSPTSGHATAQEPASAAEGERDARPSAALQSGVTRPVFLVFAGGVSLGSYEAGYAMTVAGALREMPEFQLAGVSGTSAGAINALAVALEYCAESEPEFTHTTGWGAWIPVGWRMLYDPDRVTRDAIFHHGDMIEHGLELLRSDSRTFRADCDVPVVIAVTRSEGIDDPPTGFEGELVHLVDHLTFRVTVDPDSGRPVYRNVDAETRRSASLFGLRSDEYGVIAEMDVIAGLMASAAFPMAFASVPVPVCESSELSCHEAGAIRERLYHDGGVFDNVPVRPLLPIIAEASEPMVIVVDLQSHQIPRPHGDDGTEPSPLESLRQQSSSWLDYARLRNYSGALRELAAMSVEVHRAQLRLPLVSEQLFHFLGFMDVQFRRTDYLLGVHDAIGDMHTWPSPWPAWATERMLEDDPATCLGEILDGVNHRPACARDMDAGVLTTLRALLAVIEYRCAGFQPGQAPSVCGYMERQNWRGRLPAGDPPRWNDGILSYGIGRPSSEEFALFLEELRAGPFHPELLEAVSQGGSPYLEHRPELVWSREIESAFRLLIDAQGQSRLLGQLVAESSIDALLPILPRRSVGVLANLNQAELTVEFPVFPGARVGLGVVSEWAARSDRREPWHVMAAGPVMRYGMLVWRRQSIVHLIMSVDTGIEFGPVFASLEDQALPFGTSRSEFSPNAAVFAGIAPRVLMLRRLQIDFPLRFYWLCSTPWCSEVASPNPAYSFTFRLGWSWNWPTRQSDHQRRRSRLEE